MKNDSLNVLVMEDDALLSEVLRLALSEIDAKLHFAASLKEAKKIIDTDWPNLAIMDIGLPDGDGLEFAKTHLVDSREHTGPAILFLTGKTDRRTRISAYTLNTVDYITKPFSVSELTMKAHNILNIVAKSPVDKSENFHSEYPDSGLSLIHRIYDICEQGCDNPDFGVQEAAQTLGLSVRSLQRGLQNEIEKNFSEILISTRMQKAKLLLEKKVAPKRVATLCGYRHPENFFAAFKRVVMITPKQFQDGGP